MHKFCRIVVASLTKRVITPFVIVCAVTPQLVYAQEAPHVDPARALVRTPTAESHVTTPDARQYGVARLNPGMSWEGARVGMTNVAKAEVYPALPRSHVMTESSSSKYVVTGALIGVAVYGVALAIYFNQTSSEFLGNPLALMVPAIGAAGLGALAGWVVYKARPN